jgi:hypothetical protein
MHKYSVAISYIRVQLKVSVSVIHCVSTIKVDVDISCDMNTQQVSRMLGLNVILIVLIDQNDFSAKIM